MSRSYKKKAIVKIGMSGNDKRIYHGTIRSTVKLAIKTNKEIIPDPREILNDLDYVDYISCCEDKNNCHCMRIYGRKKCKEK